MPVLPNKHYWTSQSHGGRERRKNTWKRDLENVDSKFEAQLEKDGGGGTRQSWMVTTGLWIMFHWE